MAREEDELAEEVRQAISSFNRLWVEPTLISNFNFTCKNMVALENRTKRQLVLIKLRCSLDLHNFLLD